MEPGTVQHTEHDVLEQSSAAVAAQEAARLLEAKRRHDDLWKRVQRDASDFGSWTALIDTVLKMDDIEAAREVFDAFLTRYPLCYAYWKKYADFEKRKGGIPEVVYQRGVQAFPYSPELWSYYAGLLTSQGASEDDVRSIYEHGLQYVSHDYQSTVLWSKYIAYEMARGNTQHAARLYERVMQVPLKDLQSLFKGLEGAINSRPLTDMLPDEVIVRLRNAAANRLQQQHLHQQQQEADDLAAAVAAAAPGIGDDGMGDGGMGDHAMGTGDMSIMDPAAIDAQAKALYLEEQRAVMQASQVYYAATLERYESRIKRPYFHVKPLDTAQLGVWSRYTEHVRATGTRGDGIRVYERCLVPCAAYPDFWMSYVSFLQAPNTDEDTQAARAALQRGLIHCINKPELLLFAARWEEQHGGVDAARAHYRMLLDVALVSDQQLLEATIAAANFERRHQNLTAAEELYQKHLQQARQGGSAQAHTVVFLTTRLAQLLLVHGGGVAALPRVRELLDGALVDYANNTSLWEGAIQLEQTVHADDMVPRVLDLYTRALAVGTAETAGGDDDADKTTSTGGGNDAGGDKTTAAAAGGDTTNVTTNTPEANGHPPATDTTTTSTDQKPSSKPSSSKTPLPLTDRLSLAERAIAFADAHGSTSDMQHIMASIDRIFPLSQRIGSSKDAGKRAAGEQPQGAAQVAKQPAVATGGYAGMPPAQGVGMVGGYDPAAAAYWQQQQQYAGYYGGAPAYAGGYQYGGY